jgi:hypothetical protein
MVSEGALLLPQTTLNYPQLWTIDGLAACNVCDNYVPTTPSQVQGGGGAAQDTYMMCLGVVCQAYVCVNIKVKTTSAVCMAHLCVV